MKLLLGILLGSALLWLAVAAHAGSSGRSNVPIKVLVQDSLSVTNGGNILLDNSVANPAAGGVLGPVSDSTARLNYTQTSASSKKITAQVTVNPGGHDITLTVAVAGGAGTKTLVSGGAASAAQDVYTSIAAGTLSNLAVTYGAQCTVAGTKVSASTNFVFTVTFTSVGS